ncbi:MAG: ABC transporter permease [Candidatus Brachytrichaceae bacterium NZ_4S206]|jgi:ABC-2 type transport system permease protein
MLKKYVALGKAAWALTVEYRAQIVIWMMNSILMVIMLLVWLSISRDGEVNGYSSADFVTYFMIGWIVRNLTAVWASWELDFAIREGRLSPMLLRPIHPIHNEIAINWVEKMLRMLIVVPIVAIVLVATPGVRLDLTPLNLLAFVVSVAGAWLIAFMSDYLIGMLAFWTTQTGAFIQGFYGIRLVLSGVIAPIAMFPQAVQDVLRWLPFPYMLNFSVDIAMGRIQGEAMLLRFAIQFAWAAFFIAAVRVVWKIAIRSYSAVGA